MPAIVDLSDIDPDEAEASFERELAELDAKAAAERPDELRAHAERLRDEELRRHRRDS